MNSPVRPSSYPSDGKVCNCKKSNCLKLYCECFASGNCCVPNRCNCVSCLNNVSNENQRNLAIFATLERNPNAFRSKSTDDSQLPHKKGCHCKKSFCLKKYCECFQSRIVCTDKCRCQDCKNYDNSPDLLAASSVGTFLGPNRFVKSKFSDLFNADSLPAKVSVSPTNRSIDPVLAKFASKLSNEAIRQICDKLLAESEMVAPQSKRRRSSFDCLDNSEASESPADDFIDIFCRTLKSVVLPQNS